MNAHKVVDVGSNRRIVRPIERQNNDTGEYDMTKANFIEMFKANGIEVTNRKDAGWALDFLNKKAPTGYRLKDIYLAWKAAA